MSRAKFISESTAGIDLSDQHNQTLVIVSPYPPLKTGVADYAKALVDLLKDDYQLVLVVESLSTTYSLGEFPGQVIDADEFLNRFELHKRVLYHIGNSQFHDYILNLLAKVPGVVVLHDFYIGESLLAVANFINKSDLFLTKLLDGHGSAAIWSAASDGLLGLSKKFPCSLQVLNQATKCIVHSEHAAKLAVYWYGEDALAKIAVIPHLKKLGRSLDNQKSAKLYRNLGIEPDDFIFSTYGFGGPLKGHQQIIQAWMGSEFSKNSRNKLMIIGDYPDPHYLERIKSLIRISGGAQNIIFTGYSSPEDYEDYLRVTDVAIQLRLESRGESSGTLLDCLAFGIPTIVNAIGSFNEVPDSVVWKLEGGEYLPAQLMAAMETLYRHPDVMAGYKEQAKSYVQRCHSLVPVRGAYKQIIEQSVSLTTESQTLSLKGKRRLFVDITALAYFDLKTGIQRVTRSILSNLMANQSLPFQVEPVYLHHDGVYKLARRYVLQVSGLQAQVDFDETISPVGGDLFFGLDLHPASTPGAAGLYQQWRLAGVKIYFLLHDLLPVRHPEWFPPTESPKFLAWLQTVVTYSDGIIAVSKTSADDLSAWIRTLPPSQKPSHVPRIGWFHNGADISASIPSRGIPEDAVKFLEQMKQRTSFLMVSTVEPRKGHRQTIEAFSELWNRGLDIDLVIVGKQGWMVEDLARQMLTHPRFGRNLFWLQGISDEYLEAIYPRSIALIAASEGEGFGLPIIEAATHHIHVIARDLPVFREVGGIGADYFHAQSAQSLADYLQDWLEKPSEQRADPNQIQLSTWEESTKRVLAFMLEEGHLTSS